LAFTLPKGGEDRAYRDIRGFERGKEPEKMLEKADQRMDDLAIESS
jgi:hypothetical protein